MTARDGLVSRGRGGVSRAPGVGALAALEGVVLILWNLVATPIVGRSRRRWGTVGSEASDPLPGDEFVPAPKWSTTLAVAVDAPPERVWPWVAQVGQGRGGFYSYQTLENMMGCKITNTSVILADYQDPTVGDEVHLCAGTPPLRVELADPPYALVLVGAPVEVGGEEIWGRSTWQFVVRTSPDGGSRLVTRSRYDFASSWKSRLMFGRFPLEPISFVMSRRMMLEIKRLAELRSTDRVDHERR